MDKQQTNTTDTTNPCAAAWSRWQANGKAAGMTLAELFAAARYIERTADEATTEGAALKVAVFDGMIACGAMHVSPPVRIA